MPRCGTGRAPTSAGPGASCSSAHIRSAADWNLASGAFAGRGYISERFPLDEIATAFETAEHKHGKDAIKVSIVHALN